MILDKIAKAIYDKIPEDREEIFAGIGAGIFAGIGAGILAGILVGIGAGILAGIVVGILAGIVVGIGAGIGAGILVGILVGIGAGIGAGIGDFIQSSPSLSLILILFAFLFVISETLFLFDKKKPEGQTHFLFTIERKAIAWIESSIILFSLIGIQTTIKSFPTIKDFFEQYGISLLNMVGWGTAIIIILYLYIKLNSLKYKKED